MWYFSLRIIDDHDENQHCQRWNCAIEIFWEIFFFKYLKKSFFGSGDNLFRFCEWYIKLEIYKLDVMNVRRKKNTNFYVYYKLYLIELNINIPRQVPSSVYSFSSINYNIHTYILVFNEMNRTMYDFHDSTDIL